MKDEKKDVLYLVTLKNGATVSMTKEQIEESRDLIEPARPEPAPEYRELVQKYLERKKANSPGK